MNDMDSLRSLYRPSVDEIREHLLRGLRRDDIRESEDFDRDGVVFKARAGIGPPFRLFVSHEFLSDFSVAEIKSKLLTHRILEKLKDLPKGFTLFLTTEGTFTEETEGRTLREWSDDLGGTFGFSSDRASLVDRVLSTPVDGVPLGDIPTEMQGDPEYYISCSQEFADSLIVAYVLDAAGYHDYELSRVRTELGVDFRLLLHSGRVVYLDLKTAQSPVQRRANALREQINVSLRKALREDPAMARALEGHFVQITMPEAPASRHDVVDVVSEARRFVCDTPLGDFRRGSFLPFDGEQYPNLAKLASRVYVTDGPTHLSVQEGATSFDPYDPYRRASAIIAEESKKHFNVAPLWLIVSLANTPAEFQYPDDVLDERRRLVNIDVNGTPFEQIIVGYPGNATNYGRTE